MTDSSLSDELLMFEELFKDRFTERDEVYVEFKAKSLPPPAVVHPWKVKKPWKKQWDYSARGSQRGRDGGESRYNDRDRNQSYRDRSPNRDDSRNRDRYRNDSYRNRDDRNDSYRNRDDRNSYRDQRDRRESNEHSKRD